MARLAALLLLVAVPGFAATKDAGTKPRIAVLYFQSTTANAELDVFAKGFAELMITDLATIDAVTIVERQRLEEVLAEMKLGETRFADKNAFAKVGQILGAEYIVMGTILSGGNGKMFIAPRVIRTEKNEVVGGAVARVSIDPADILAAEEQLVAKVSEAIVKDAKLAEAAPPPPKRDHKLPYATGLKYARALDAKDKKDKATQKQLLSEVVQEQPQFKLAQADLLSLRD